MQQLIFIRILRFFFENLYRQVYLRELSKELRLSPFAIKKYADLMLEEGLILEERRANTRYFKANIDSLFFKHLKIAFSIDILMKSGLVGYLKESVPGVSSIVLFGSVAKGEDDMRSDVDILVIGKKKRLDIAKFTKQIGKEISIHIFSWGEWVKHAKADRAFYFEVIGHGIPLFGQLPLVNK